MKRLFIDAYKVFEDLYLGFTQKKDQGEVKDIIVLFTGTDDPQTGKSWCPHCVYAKPVLEKAIANSPSDDRVTFVTVRVGHREEWKTPENPYRLHELKINCVPTLVSLAKNMRLNGSECWDPTKVGEFFSKIF